MILWTTFAFFSLLTVAPSAATDINGSTNLVASAPRRLEDADLQYAFLANYTMSLLTCESGETFINGKTGEYEYSSVIYRLCPSNGNCNRGDCDSGCGDFIVGLNAFLRRYFANQENFHNRLVENLQDDEKNSTFSDINAFIAGLSECREYVPHNNGTKHYFIGPTCTEDGFDVKLGLFLDEYCSTFAEAGTFEDLSDGAALPFSSGGLVTSYCNSCVESNGEAEVRPLCWDLYENSGKCDTHMEYFHESGRQQDSCEFIFSLLPKNTIINIRYPKSLYIEGGYDHRIAQFGPSLPPELALNRSAVIEYNLVYAGWDANYSSFCDPDDVLAIDPPHQPFVLMVDRASCSFLSQVRRAQSIGAAAVLIADLSCHCSDPVSIESCDELFKVCRPLAPDMVDDGSGASDIVIPSYLLNKYEADQIRDFLNDASDEMVKAEFAGNPLPWDTASTTQSGPSSSPTTTESASPSFAPALVSVVLFHWLSMVLIAFNLE